MNITLGIILIIHIALAIFSLFYATITAVMPSKEKFGRVYILTSGTLLSGIILAVTTPATFGKFCISGLLYIGIIAICITFGKRSLSYLR